MDKFITFVAQRHNIQPVFFSIPFIVMVLICLPMAQETFLCANSWKCAFSNSAVYSTFCVAFFWKFLRIFCRSFFPGLLSCFCVCVSFVTKFVFFATAIMVVIFLSFNSISPLSGSLANQFFCAFRTPVFFGDLLSAFFALTLIAVLSRPVAIKIRSWLRDLAMTASLVYDDFSHDRFSNKRFWLEPVSVHNTVTGSLYYQREFSFCQDD